MSVSALLLGAAAWATGVTVAAPIAGYVLAPRVLRKRATTPAASSVLFEVWVMMCAPEERLDAAPTGRPSVFSTTGLDPPIITTNEQ